MLSLTELGWGLCSEQHISITWGLCPPEHICSSSVPTQGRSSAAELPLCDASLLSRVLCSKPA